MSTPAPPLSLPQQLARAALLAGGIVVLVAPWVMYHWWSMIIPAMACALPSLVVGPWRYRAVAAALIAISLLLGILTWQADQRAKEEARRHYAEPPP